MTTHMTPLARAEGNALAYWHDLEEAIARGDRLGARFAAGWLVFWTRTAEDLSEVSFDTTDAAE